ncbi:hypothetical protein ACOBR2_02945 [Telmatobacter bradus]|uniref:hypothetical protein n=1 Tax=Telmatobacter bradus TaxID=474953 RepID=UPI003B43A638
MRQLYFISRLALSVSLECAIPAHFRDEFPEFSIFGDLDPANVRLTVPCFGAETFCSHGLLIWPYATLA